MSHAFIDETSFTYGEKTIIEIVEEDGWVLDQTDLVFRSTLSSSRDKFLKSGQQEAKAGDVIALLTFRR